MPHLKILVLSKCHLGKVSELKKGNWPSLSQLEIRFLLDILENNQVTDVEELAKIGSKSFEKFAIEDSSGQSQCPNLNFMHKIESENMKIICNELLTKG